VDDGMLQAIQQGESDPQVLAELAKGRLREKLPMLRLALDGRVQAHHQLLIGELLDHLDYLDRVIHRVEVNIAALVAKEEKAVELLLTLPATGPVTQNYKNYCYYCSVHKIFPPTKSSYLVCTAQAESAFNSSCIFS